MSYAMSKIDFHIDFVLAKFAIPIHTVDIMASSKFDLVHCILCE